MRTGSIVRLTWRTVLWSDERRMRDSRARSLDDLLHGSSSTSARSRCTTARREERSQRTSSAQHRWDGSRCEPCSR